MPNRNTHRRPTFWRKAIRDKFRDERCAVCGSDYKVTIDHIIPLAQGGGNDLSNLQALCEPCNLHKGGRLSSDEMKRWYDANRDAIDADRRYRERNRYTNHYDWS